MTANLKPRNERDVSQQAFEARSAHLFDDIPGARIQFGADGQSGAKVEITLVGENSDLLTQTAALLAAEMRTIPGLSNPVSDAAAAKPELVITPDKAKMASVGVTSSEIASLLSIATLGDADRALAKYNLGDRQIYVIPTLSDAARSDLSILRSLSVRGSAATVPLGSIASFTFGAGPTSIRHIDGERTVSVEADLNGPTLGEARAAVEALPVMKTLPAGISERAEGDAKRMAELFSGFIMAIAIGILLMFATLVLLFNSFLQPITILTALPLSIGGAFAFST